MNKNLLFNTGMLICLLISFLLHPHISRGQEIPSPVRINEFMALNSTILSDEDGEKSDWIEIHNPSTSPVSLLNWLLTDDIEAPQKWLLPEVTIEANGYLIVFASGKDRAVAGQELHTNFKLSGTGEYLALSDANGNIVSAFDPAYPAQHTDFSFAYTGDNYVITSQPTPGAANSVEGSEIYPKPEFSHTLGFYDAPFQLTISSPYPEAQIYYTTDGSEPGPANGNLYSGPVNISTTTVVRAVVVKSGNIHKNIATQTYLFLDDVIKQPNNPPGYPSTWGSFTQITGTAQADYEMDPEITQDPKYASLMKEALLSIPTMSIVTNKDNLFSKSTDPEKGGIYIYTGTPVGNNIGKGWERPASIELINPDGSREFQADAALELHGGHSRLAEKSPKHSFRISFKSQYGPSKLEYPLFGEEGAESFNSFNLRAGFGNQAHHHSHDERERWQFVRDIWAKDTQAAMGQPAGRGGYVHLYINGLYWGLYNPTERIDDDYAESYFGGDEADYDIMKDYGELAYGERTAWDAMMAIARQGLSDNATYQKLLGNSANGTPNSAYEAYVDPVNLADYMILNFYGSNADWDHHNWVAVRNRLNPGTGFKFFSWDAERILEDPNNNVLDENNEGSPSALFQAMMKNAQFKDLFARRLQKHLYNGGALSPEAALSRYMERAGEIEMAVIAESARWGDYRKDVHNYSRGPFSTVYTKDHWLKARNYIRDQYFPARREIFIAQLKQKGWFPSIEAPTFSINGKVMDHQTILAKEDKLGMNSSGKVYYTTNGSDPKTAVGGIAANAILYSEPVSLSHSMHIMARNLNGTSWSAISELEFNAPEDLTNLKITEIHYHPLDEGATAGGSYEFIELKNTGTVPLNLTDVKFNEGISYSFPEGTMVEPGKFIVLASSPEHFKARYNFDAFGKYEGALDNAGEELGLVHSTFGEIIFMDYDDADPWPVKSDGEGFSLVPTEADPTGDPLDAANWRASTEIHGSPGKDDPDLATEPDPDPDPDPVLAVDRDLEEMILLEQNVPNPFYGSTEIKFTLSQPDFVQLKVFNLYGKEIRTLVNENKGTGTYSNSFHAEGLPAGIYVYQLRVGKELVKTKRMVYLR